MSSQLSRSPATHGSRDRRRKNDVLERDKWYICADDRTGPVYLHAFIVAASEAVAIVQASPQPSPVPVGAGVAARETRERGLSV